MNETKVSNISSEAAENATEEDEENKTAVNERKEYINSRITVKRNNSQEQLFVHIVPFSYTLGNQFRGEQHEDQITQILNSVFTELMQENSTRTFSFMDIKSF